MSTHDPLATEVASCEAMYVPSLLPEQSSALIPPSTKRNQEQSPLLRLPAELRNRIFGYVVGPPTLVYLGYNLCGRLRISRAYMRVKRIGQTSRQIRAETHLRFLRQNVLQFKRQTFKRCMRTFTAEEQNAIRRVRVYETEALGRPLGCGQAFTAEEQNAIRRVRLCQMEARECGPGRGPGLCENVGKLGGLEKIVLLVNIYEDAEEHKNRKILMGWFSNKLNSVVRHKVEFEFLEREKWNRY